ncbi:MAG: DUF748 domain-containing protein [Bacteroidetes bacterium]|nr:DUF748 domain-containing protein [Bacteroidota bacterium]
MYNQRSEEAAIRNLKVKNRKPKGKKKLKIVLVSIVVLLIIFRLFLPAIVLHFVNKKLSTIKEYYGHVEDIDIALLRGAYIINDIKLVKIGNNQGKSDTVPFFKASSIDLSVQWKAIFKRRIVGEIYVENPVINFVKGKHNEEDAKADTADFRRIIKDLMPLTINHFEITNGEIHYLDPFSTPKLDLALKELKIVASNLSNVNDSNKVLPANVIANGKAYGGTFHLSTDFDAFQEKPTFDMNAEIKNVNLVLLNDFLQAYAKFEVTEGNFGLYTEFAGKDGGFGGYVKPVIKHFKVKKEGTFNERFYETIIGASASLLKNHNTNEIATKVDIKGKFNDPTINLWRATGFVLRNAFVHALKPSIDNTINIHKLDDVTDKTFLEKIFGNGKHKKKKH